MKHSIFNNLKVQDYSVSKEKFKLLYDEASDMFVTTPQPDLGKLSNYYKSEDYISHTSSKRNFFEYVYHMVRQYTLQQKLKQINSLKVEGNKLLDIGSGTGDFLHKASTNGWQVLGIEPNAEARAFANMKTNNKVYDTEQLEQFSSHKFDVITLWHVLEHLPNLETQIMQLKRLLKPNGKLIIAVPNYKSYDAYYYKNFWAAFDVPRHLWHFSKEAITYHFGKQNMIVEAIKPMRFDAYYVSLLSEKYKTGSMNVIKAFWVGFKSNWKARRTKSYSSLIYIIKNT